MKFDLTKMATFGVAGNFTGHLEQAGEASDFVNVKTKEAIAPKAMFPTYIPFKQSSDNECKNQVTPAFLSILPVSTKLPAIVPTFDILNVCLTSAFPIICSSNFGASIPFIAASTSSIA